jgi:hypothetical protein
VREEIVKIPNHIFGKFFFKKKKKKRAGPGPTHSRLGLQGWPQPSHVAGLMFQPTSQVGTVTSKKMKIIR